MRLSQGAAAMTVAFDIARGFAWYAAILACVAALSWLMLPTDRTRIVTALLGGFSIVFVIAVAAVIVITRLEPPR